ncbi:MAG: D-alanyl-D-alanine carboxypeptidase [Hyphomonas sp.]|uniref:D-alanyl-D-alanine carboxypeptidase family protein n=1 Tax=Hyphomonas sp. TaxID=87 RepID=UPI0017AF5798|nr:D-alanyl-D-alanine carboxypeptidase family protein [Hyphomonas sp.]MBU3922384.1 D-alanyl-D-alanine carboxypeptidase [Alphaproteobacteria bacterium]MBA3067912.1 D-alanyl-D-alanine carboxypeptidase [Hyphomonas sp.]MBU4061249.1 D-alanyl-D-alanine carboxypeptidase [Alphaproteobacteria bacterium]MBU4162502.1 D-alanyl-D-alanine carboxypeptidase [Alphaproteobacteria bacterium]MBU4568301.1 D-alanyl-D-alanine carboxypeptidase [Alphaproteobacteria bacterium]
MALLSLSFYRSAATSMAIGSTALVLAPAALAEKYAAFVMDADTGEILHERNADDARYPASLTKVMTLYLLFDALNAGDVKLTDKMTVSKNAAAQAPSNLKLKAGTKIKVEDAILALVTKSANDVAVVIAEHLGGTERKFAVKMTEKARDLGLSNTTFKNASGLPNTAQVTTAHDLALLADALLEQHAQYYHYFQNEKFAWGRMVYKNHNDLIGEVVGVDGIKTGYTRASGFNLMTSAERDGHRVIAVMLGGASAKSRNDHVAALVEAAFATYGGPADPSSPQLRGTTVFAAVQVPANPNAAAEPMLNGKPFSAFQAEAINLTLVESTDEGMDEEMMVVEGDSSDELAAVQPSPALPAPGASFSVAEYEARQTEERAAAAAGLTVAEYQARQTAHPAPGSDVADYVFRQTKR